MPPAFGRAARVFSVLLVFAFSGCLTSAQLVQSSLKLTSEQQSQIHDLSARVLKHTDSVGCKKSCAILVANFAGETGSTSGMGMQLADEVSAQLAAQAGGNIQIASRQHLQQYLLKGLPFGLNKQAVETVSKWRCEPAKVDDRPVSTIVPIEVTFRLY